MNDWLAWLIQKRRSAERAETLAMVVLRLTFVAVMAGVGTIVIRQSQTFGNTTPYFVISGILLIAAGVIGLDMFFEKKRIEIISAIYFGLLVGMLLTYLMGVALTPILLNVQAADSYLMLLAAVLCYTCVSMLLQTKDDFRFVIPYVEFVRELKGSRPLILDTSSIIDGRLANLADTAILDNQVVMPRFVLQELQAIADSGDKLRRTRGRRGLDILNKLQHHQNLDFVIYDREPPEWSMLPVDMKLVALAKQLNGKLVTSDFNLNKVAKVQNVPVVNLNEIANALRPQFLPGEAITLRIVKNGEGQEQGVGYLDDGTMVVVEGGRNHVGKTSEVVVTSHLQTQSGRMLFARIDDAA